MTIFIIWLIALVLIGYFVNQRWQTVSAGLDKMLPRPLKTHGDNRWLWVGALAVLGATTLVRPVEILLVAILLGIIAAVVYKLIGWASSKAPH
ncbi:MULTISPECIES: hypothetical protein [Halomonadaceae]|jgi:hypothetical protein|uniref:hypothetical protein n=1 Tax=Halomonadaceae TaxID=28256 RepID=UPI000A288497|nr:MULTISPECIES: hypothetical protein [Halomonas]MCW4148621.1 hypothetical protein [Halomonas sp. 18H]MCZ0930258.1 hypothetical protein [Halomonas janggokensis]MDR5884889.1 hypothetical protein [Halomonas janggokensis]QPL45094.1 hypothetical protein IT895_12955 [Halomonas sp. A40-4]